MARAVRYSTWRRRDPGVVASFDDLDLPAARDLVRTVLDSASPGRDLSAEESRSLLAGAGITLAASMLEAPDGGVDVVLTVHDDKSFGALVSFGLRGVATELLGDRAYATVPLTTADAADLIAAPRAAPLLDGYGGRTPTDREALAQLALRISLLADALPEISECTLGVTASPDGALVTTAQIWVGPPTARPDSGPRRLRGL